MATLETRIARIEERRPPPIEGHAARDEFLSRMFRDNAPHLADGPIRLSGRQLEHIQSRPVLGSIFSGAELVRDDNHAGSIATALSALLAKPVSLRTRLDALEARHDNSREITPEHRAKIVEAAMPNGGSTPAEREFLTRWIAGTASHAEAVAVGLFPLDTRDGAGCIIRVKFVEGQPGPVREVMSIVKEMPSLPVETIRVQSDPIPDPAPIQPTKPIKSQLNTDLDWLDKAFLSMPKPKA